MPYLQGCATGKCPVVEIGGALGKGGVVWKEPGAAGWGLIGTAMAA